nr:glycosyltransferase family 4 protein [Actinomycetota bacterium]
VLTTAIPELSLPPGPRLLGHIRLGIRTLTAAVAVRRSAAGADGILLNGLLGLPAVALARSRLPVVYLVHEVIRRPDRVRLLRWLRGAVDTTIAVSTASAAALADAGLDALVVPNGTLWPVEPALPSPPSPAIVGCVAALTVGKGQHVLLEALSLLERADVLVELVGEALPKDDAYAAALRAQADAVELRDRVRFLGHVAKPLDRIRTWTVAVLPSVEPEAQPLAVLEAMSLGVPVVGTDHGGIPETLGEAGLVVPPGDATALADALARLISDAAVHRRCAAAGPIRVARSYALSERIAELLDAIAAPLA